MSGVLLFALNILILTVGQIMFKFGARSMNENEGSALSMFWNPVILLALFFYGLGSILWILVLRRYQLSIAYPVLSITYVFVTIASAYFFQETFTIGKAVGLGLIILGILVIARQA